MSNIRCKVFSVLAFSILASQACYPEVDGSTDSFYPVEIKKYYLQHQSGVTTFVDRGLDRYGDREYAENPADVGFSGGGQIP